MATQVATLAGAQTGIDDEALEALRMSLRGELLTPADPLRRDQSSVHRRRDQGSPGCDSLHGRGRRGGGRELRA